MITIGVTGLISSGKSTVSYVLSEILCAKIFDADFCIHSMYKNNRSLFLEMKKRIPYSIVDGCICRRSLLNFLSYNSENWDLLDSIIKPYFKQELDNFLSDNVASKYLILDVPLLYSSGVHKKCDFVVGVISEGENNLNYSANIILARQKKLRMLEEIELKSDFLIFNSQNMDLLIKECNKICKSIKNS